MRKTGPARRHYTVVPPAPPREAARESPPHPAGGGRHRRADGDVRSLPTRLPRRVTPTASARRRPIPEAGDRTPIRMPFSSGRWRRTWSPGRWSPGGRRSPRRPPCSGGSTPGPRGTWPPRPTTAALAGLPDPGGYTAAEPLGARVVARAVRATPRRPVCRDARERVRAEFLTARARGKFTRLPRPPGTGASGSWGRPGPRRQSFCPRPTPGGFGRRIDTRTATTTPTRGLPRAVRVSPGRRRIDLPPFRYPGPLV